MAECRQHDARGECSISNVLFYADMDRSLFIREQKDNLENSRVRCHAFPQRNPALPEKPSKTLEWKLRIVEVRDLAVRGMSRLAASEMSGRDRFAVAVMGQSAQHCPYLFHLARPL
jgi:hypothetical protein